MTWTVTLGGVDTQQTFTDESLDALRYVDESIGLPAILQRIVEHVRDGWKATSSSALTIASSGSLSLTCTVNRPWTTNLPLRVVKSGSTASYMDGTVVSYNTSSGALVLTLTAGDVVGVTGASWVVTLSGAGAVGPQGPAASSASSTVAGIIRIATTAEMAAMTSAVLAVTPALFAAQTASTSALGVVRIATTAEMAASTSTTLVVTPALFAGQVATTSALGVVRFANAAEVSAATSATVVVSPANMSAFQAVSFTVVSSNFTVVAGGRYLANLTAAAFTMTLKATPTAGDTFELLTYGTYALAVARNGEEIANVADDGTIPGSSNVVMRWVYLNSTYGWVYGGAS